MDLVGSLRSRGCSSVVAPSILWSRFVSVRLFSLFGTFQINLTYRIFIECLVWNKDSLFRFTISNYNTVPQMIK